MQDKIRKYSHDIYISGLGVVILGFWSLVKTILSITAGAAQGFNPDEYEGFERIVFTVVFWTIILIASAFVLWIHMFIGINAMKVGRGERRKKRFLIVCFLLMVFLIFELPTYFFTLSTEEAFDTALAAITVDLTMIFLLGSILYYNKQISKLNYKKRK